MIIELATLQGSKAKYRLLSVRAERKVFHIILLAKCKPFCIGYGVFQLEIGYFYESLEKGIKIRCFNWRWQWLRNMEGEV